VSFVSFGEKNIECGLEVFEELLWRETSGCAVELEVVVVVTADSLVDVL
jgi:hypothetical protein